MVWERQRKVWRYCSQFVVEAQMSGVESHSEVLFAVVQTAGLVVGG